MGEAAFPDPDGRPAAAQPDMDALLAGLRDQGGARFDAAGWHYLETLARRAAAHEGSVRRLLDAKLERAVAAFSARLAHARSAAAGVLAATCAKHPQDATELHRLSASSDFRGLRQMRARLEAREQGAALAQLVSQLEHVSAGEAGQAPAPHAPARAPAAGSPALELKTVRESRATWARMSVDRQLALAKKQAPQNAGPINSHMLVVRSLAMMQDISPDYLNRVVSYADTLLALRPVEKEAAVKRKKAPVGKAGKAVKSSKK